MVIGRRSSVLNEETPRMSEKPSYRDAARSIAERT